MRKASRRSLVKRSTTHSEFDPTLLGVAFVLALSFGFFSGVAMLGGAAGWWPIGPWWSGIRQAHGHVQLFGWTAPFVLGVGFFFFPRSRGAPLAFPGLLPVIAALIGGGVMLRAVSQAALSVAGASGPTTTLVSTTRVLFGLSGVLAGAGVLVAVFLLAATFRGGPPIAKRIHLVPVLPLIGSAFFSLVVASAVNGYSTITAAIAGSAVVDARLDRFVVELVVFGFALPVTQAVSVQTFPLFLRLPALSSRTVVAVALGYLVSAATMLAGVAAGCRVLEGAGAIGIAVALVAYTLLLDVLTRLRAPWVIAKLPGLPVDVRRPTRTGLPDRGEYGRFEWLVYSAYVWQLVGAVLLGANGATDLAGRSPLFSPDAARHAFGMGFITLLICGMAIRMIPGFNRGRLAFPRAVTVLAIAGNAAAACRVIPLLLPYDLGGPAGALALALSGVFAWLLIALLGVMLAVTMRRTRAARVLRAP